MNTSRERDLVELVDEEGTALGSATVADAHSAPGMRHRAFSVHLMDGKGRLLLQQRALTKTRFAGRWGNATCGHPAPGEKPASAASRRLFEELGLGAVELTEVGVYGYRAEDPETGRVEHEYDHVFLGLLSSEVARPDPSEVAALRWMPTTELLRALKRQPSEFVPWLAGVTDIALGGTL